MLAAQIANPKNSELSYLTELSNRAPRAYLTEWILALRFCGVELYPICHS